MAREFDYKQVLVIRTDLDMSTGKIAVQASHAAVMAADESRKAKLDWAKSWAREGQMKVAVKVGSEEELRRLADEARSLRLPAAIVVDMGLTEIPPNTVTALGIGPAPSETVDRVTGRLPLL